MSNVKTYEVVLHADHGAEAHRVVSLGDARDLAQGLAFSGPCWIQDSNSKLVVESVQQRRCY